MPDDAVDLRVDDTPTGFRAWCPGIPAVDFEAPDMNDSVIGALRQLNGILGLTQKEDGSWT